MTSKVFTQGTVIDSEWLNDVNNVTYNRTSGEISIKEFGVTGDGSDESTAIALALASVAITKHKLIIPNGTYKGTFVLSGVGYANITIEGESTDGVILEAKDNATPVFSISSSAFYPTLRHLTISPGSTGNNGTHYGIYNNAVSGMTLDDIKVSGFNNNIHIVENNNNRLSKIVSTAPVFAAGITGCGIYASGLGAAGPGFWLKDSSITNGKFGIYLDAIEAPVISDSECLLQSDTGLYVTNSVPTYSTGPFLTNFFADSSSQAAIYLQKQINSMLSNVWVSGSAGASKGLVLSDTLKGTYNIQAFNNQGYAVHLAGGSKFNTFTGVVSNNASDGIVIDNGCFGNTFNGVAIHANTGRGYNWNDVTVDEPNALIGCYVAGNGVANVKQGKDIDVGGNYLTGQTSSFQYTRAAITASQATTMGGIADQVVMHRSGAIVAFSTYLTAATTAGTLNVRPMVNGAVKDTLLVNMTSGANAQYGYVSLLGKSVRFAAGDRIAAYFDADAGFLPSGTANLSATCWVVFD